MSDHECRLGLEPIGAQRAQSTGDGPPQPPEGQRCAGAEHGLDPDKEVMKKALEEALS